MRPAKGDSSTVDTSKGLTYHYRESSLSVNMIDIITEPHPVAPSVPSAITPDTRAAIEQMYFTYRAFTSGPDALLAERGLGRAHHRILYFVGRQPGIAVGALLETLQISKQALSAPLKRLQEFSLVEVRAADQDRRVRRLTLSAAGAQLEAQLSEQQAQWINTAFARVTAEDIASWRRVMHALEQ